MQRILVSLSCALALATGGAIAQQQPGSDRTLTEKAKDAAQAVGEKTKETTGKVLEKVEQTAQPNDRPAGEGSQANQSSTTSEPSSRGTTAMGAPGATDPEQMQRQADADLKAAKAQCETQQGHQQTICEKEAEAAHAQAEVDVERAKAAISGSSQTR